jgi:hypothetical protein
MITVGHPKTIVPPWAVTSPIRAAGIPLISTVDDPIMILSGGPVQIQRSPARAAGKPPIRTVGLPGGRTGPPTWGTTPVTMGHTCISVIRAANGIFYVVVFRQSSQFIFTIDPLISVIPLLPILVLPAPSILMEASAFMLSCGALIEIDFPAFIVRSMAD